MKSLMKTSIAVAVLVVMISQAKPFILNIMNTSLSQYEKLANEIVTTDENGSIALNGEPADTLLNDMGQAADDITIILTEQAEEILNVETADTEEIEGMQKTVNTFFEWLMDLISPLMGKEGN